MCSYASLNPLIRSFSQSILEEPMLERLKLICSGMKFQGLLRTLWSCVRETSLRMMSSWLTQEASSIELSLTLWSKEAISHVEMELEESQFMAENSTMRTSSWPMSLFVCLWPTLGKTQMAVSSSWPPPTQPGSMESTSSSEKWDKARMSSRLLKRSALQAEDPQRKSKSDPAEPKNYDRHHPSE